MCSSTAYRSGAGVRCGLPFCLLIVDPTTGALGAVDDADVGRIVFFDPESRTVTREVSIPDLGSDEGEDALVATGP